MTSEIRVNSIKNRSGLSTVTWNDEGIEVVGIATAIELDVSGNATIGGNLGVAGTITYEDVTNVDSVGVITAKEGIRIGAGKSIGSDGAAVVYYGDGSNLTGAGPSLANGSNDRVVTATGANALTGEANLTFTGSILTVTNGSGASELTLVTPSANDSGVYFNDGSNAGALSYDHSDNSMRFRVNSTEKVRIDSTGRVSAGKHGVGTYNDASEWFKVQSNDSAANISVVGSNDTHSSLNLGDEDDFNIQKIRSDHTNNSLQFFTSNYEKLRITSGGDVSIGQIDPSSGATLHVRSTTNAHTKIELSTKDNYNGSHQDAYISFVQQNGTEIALIHCDTEVGAANRADLAFYTNHGGVYERVRIKDQGRIDILGDGQATGFHLSNKYGQAAIFGGMYYNGSSWVRTSTSGRKPAGICFYTGGNIAFLTAPESSGTSATMAEKARFSNLGNFNIGVVGNAVGGAPSSGEGKVNIYHSGAGANDWAMQVRQDSGSNGNGVFIRAGNGASKMALDVRAYNEANVLLQVNGAGQVTKPLNPSFYGRGYNGNSSYNWLFDAVASSNGEHNQGSHFNNSTGIFTCPIAGHYFIGGGWGFLATANYGMMGFRYNGNTQLNLWEDGRSGAGNKHVSASFGLVIQCNVNDTLSFVSHSSYAFPDTSTAYAWGSIYLVG